MVDHLIKNDSGVELWRLHINNKDFKELILKSVNYDGFWMSVLRIWLTETFEPKTQHEQIKK